MFNNQNTASEFNTLRQEVIDTIRTSRITAYIDDSIKMELEKAISNIKEIDTKNITNISVNDMNNLIDLILKIIDIPYSDIVEENKKNIISINENIKKLKEDYANELLILNTNKDLTVDKREEALVSLQKKYTEDLKELTLSLTMAKDIVKYFSDEYYLSVEKNIIKDDKGNIDIKNLNSYKIVSLSLLKYLLKKNILSTASCKGACVGTNKSK